MYDYGQIVEDLLVWYDSHARVLPWRSNPLPYYVWVSEIMLQQTRVEAVKGYFARFIEKLPDVKALAAADEDVILKLWEGLGYYNRVRNMQLAAKTVMEEYGGCIPEDTKELLKLKGIGSYTAGAIASIAYGKRVPAVDGNVLRVMHRLSANANDIMKQSTKNNMEKQLLSIMPERAGAFNQAVMDLGAMVCIPNGKPLCDSCPLNKYCIAHKTGREQDFPVKSSKKPRRIKEKTVLLLEAHGKYAIRKRSATGLLAGMWELPSIEGKIGKEEILALYGEEKENVKIDALGDGKHIFSHVEWLMTGYCIHLEREVQNEEYIWVTPEEIDGKYAIPTAFSRYTKFLR